VARVWRRLEVGQPRYRRGAGQWADGGEAEARAGNRGRPPRVRHLALQFIEDSYATAASFRESGSWTVQTQAGAKPFEV
jgi:hypothetical protein